MNNTNQNTAGLAQIVGKEFDARVYAEQIKGVLSEYECVTPRAVINNEIVPVLPSGQEILISGYGKPNPNSWFNQQHKIKIFGEGITIPSISNILIPATAVAAGFAVVAYDIFHPSTASATDDSQDTTSTTNISPKDSTLVSSDTTVTIDPIAGVAGVVKKTRIITKTYEVRGKETKSTLINAPLSQNVSTLDTTVTVEGAKIDSVIATFFEHYTPYRLVGFDSGNVKLKITDLSDRKLSAYQRSLGEEGLIRSAQLKKDLPMLDSVDVANTLIANGANYKIDEIIDMMEEKSNGYYIKPEHIKKFRGLCNQSGAEIGYIFAKKNTKIKVGIDHIVEHILQNYKTLPELTEEHPEIVTMIEGYTQTEVDSLVNERTKPLVMELEKQRIEHEKQLAAQKDTLKVQKGEEVIISPEMLIKEYQTEQTGTSLIQKLKKKFRHNDVTAGAYYDGENTNLKRPGINMNLGGSGVSAKGDVQYWIFNADGSFGYGTLYSGTYSSGNEKIGDMEGSKFSGRVGAGVETRNLQSINMIAKAIVEGGNQAIVNNYGNVCSGDNDITRKLNLGVKAGFNINRELNYNIVFFGDKLNIDFIAEYLTTAAGKRYTQDVATGKIFNDDKTYKENMTAIGVSIAVGELSRYTGNPNHKGIYFAIAPSYQTVDVTTSIGKSCDNYTGAAFELGIKNFIFEAYGYGKTGKGVFGDVGGFKAGASAGARF